MRVEELDYDLPPDRIATTPAEPRDSAKLMVIRRRPDAEPAIEHRRVRDLPGLGVLRAGDLFVVNRTRVLPAYFEGTRAGTGGAIRGLYIETAGPGQWRVMLESRGTLQPGERVTLRDGVALELVRREERGKWVVGVEGASGDAGDTLARVGDTPLPPYIRKMRRQLALPELQPGDAERYNTVYARETGSVAAPTAGLHLTPNLLAELDALGVRRAEVVLDVSLGTFEPIRTDTLEAHPMHEERLRVPAETIALLRETRARGGRIVPIGTTTIRALESLPADWETLRDDYAAATRLFIHPDLPGGFTFRFADAAMTNFHLPRSTLLAMIATLPDVGLDRLKSWYSLAIAEGYRFYSYGDAMLIA